jgi:hypothetical protein
MVIFNQMPTKNEMERAQRQQEWIKKKGIK